MIVVKAELQRLKPLRLRLLYVVAEATTHKDFGASAKDFETSTKDCRTTTPSEEVWG